MKILKKSMMTKRIHTMEIDVTQKQIDQWLAGELIQKAMPNLTVDEREFIKTGVTHDEWEAAYGETARNE